MLQLLIRPALTLAGVMLFTGCASIVSGNDQTVFVETRHDGDRVIGAACELNNGKSTFHVTTPGSVAIESAYEDMTVKCEKEGLPSGFAIVKSGAKPMALGNILVGGLIGAAVDSGSGAAYDYPTLITVIMEEAVEPVTTVSVSSETVAGSVSEEQK